MQSMLRYLTSYEKTLACWCCSKKSHEATKIIQIHPSGGPCKSVLNWIPIYQIIVEIFHLKVKKIQSNMKPHFEPDRDAEIFDIIWAHFGVLMALQEKSRGHRNDWDSSFWLREYLHQMSFQYIKSLSRYFTKCRISQAGGTETQPGISYSCDPKAQLHKTPVM